jgi:serine/threonine-protein kinase
MTTNPDSTEFHCIQCHRAIDPEFRACPYCGTPITDFVRRYTRELIDGKYRVLSRLGIGGMGEVFKVQHVHLNSIRVVKMMRPDLLGEDAKERFIREARLATRVHHTNVASLHDFSTLPDGTFYMVWEFIDGVDLAEILRRRGTLSPRKAASLAIEALYGLDAIHRAGIVHRDISPENLMITRDERGDEHVKIIDLGIAKTGDSDGATKTGMFVGKWKYCSPEHLGFLPPGEHIDGRADLYSFGIVLYEMLTGRAPFNAETPQQYIVMHSRELPSAITLPEQFAPAAPQLEAAVFRSLEKDRSRRYATAAEFAAELQQILPSLPDAEDTPTLVTPIQAGIATVRDALPAASATAAGAIASGTQRNTFPPAAPTIAVPARAAETQRNTIAPAAPTIAVPVYAGPPPAVVPTAAAPAVETKRSNGPMLFVIAALLSAVLVIGVVFGVFIIPRLAELRHHDAANTTITTPTGVPSGTSVAVHETTVTNTTPAAAATETTSTTATTDTAPPPTATVPPAKPHPVASSATESTASPVPERAATAPAPATGNDTIDSSGKPMFGRRSHLLVESEEYRSGFQRGIIRDYSDLASGHFDANWAAIAPNVRLSNYRVVLSGLRNLTSLQNAAVTSTLGPTLQERLNEIATDHNASSTVSARGAIFWAETSPEKKRGIGVEMIFVDPSGRVIAKVRHTVFDRSIEDAAEGIADALADFVDDGPVIER